MSSDQPKFMGLIADLNPINYQAEKAKFLANPTFNPQFEYIRDFDETELLKHGLPDEQYRPLAQRIIDTALGQTSATELQEERGPVISQAEVTKALEDFLSAHGLEKRYKLIWSANFVSRAAVSADNTIKLRLPSNVRQADLEGLLYHEIGTHVLRRVNYEQQPWYHKREQFGFLPHMRTEEGLAVLHSLLPKADALAYRPAIYYLTTFIALEGSFLDVWQYLQPFYPNDPEIAFTLAAKKKRGLTDTSRPGGFSKDHLYFEGFIEVTKFLIEQNFPLNGLYFGKLAWQDMTRAIELNPDFEPLLPNFYTNDPEDYQQRVIKIAQTNFLI